MWLNDDWENNFKAWQFSRCCKDIVIHPWAARAWITQQIVTQLFQFLVLHKLVLKPNNLLSERVDLQWLFCYLGSIIHTPGWKLHLQFILSYDLSSLTLNSIPQLELFIFSFDARAKIYGFRETWEEWKSEIISCNAEGAKWFIRVVP